MSVFNTSVSGGGSTETVQVTINNNSGDESVLIYWGLTLADGTVTGGLMYNGTSNTFTVKKGSLVCAATIAYGSMFTQVICTGNLDPLTLITFIANGDGTISAL